MSRLQQCANCGDPAPTAWLCPKCESIKQEAQQRCHGLGYYSGHQVTGAVYSALTDYRESRMRLRDELEPESEIAAPV